MERPIYDYGSVAARRASELAGQSGRVLQQAAQDQLRYWSRRLGKVIAEKPGTSLGVALGIGVFIGWMIKRR
jgi:ElaB/YqjD/DUF883 family membrane-anchored ribosome-binding protein